MTLLAKESNIAVLHERKKKIILPPWRRERCRVGSSRWDLPTPSGGIAVCAGFLYRTFQESMWNTQSQHLYHELSAAWVLCVCVCIHMYSLIFLTWEDEEKKKRKERDPIHWFVCQVAAMAVPGLGQAQEEEVGNSVPVPHVDGRNTITWALLSTSQGLPEQETGVRSWELNPGTLNRGQHLNPKADHLPLSSELKWKLTRENRAGAYALLRSDVIPSSYS